MASLGYRDPYHSPKATIVKATFVLSLVDATAVEHKATALARALSRLIVWLKFSTVLGLEYYNRLGFAH